MNQSPDMTDDLSHLAQLIKQKAVVFERVTLSSGQQADFYIDLRRVTLDVEVAPLIGKVMCELVADWHPQMAGGLTLGADPVVSAMVHASSLSNQPLSGAIVRKSAKTHGLQRQVEGPDVKGKRVVAVEDTSTTGGSVLTAVDAMRAAGATVVGVAVIVDRGARATVESAGLDYRAAISLAELGLD
jgi:orotate phosphoribosyltransferase